MWSTQDTQKLKLSHDMCGQCDHGAASMNDGARPVPYLYTASW